MLPDMGPGWRMVHGSLRLAPNAIRLEQIQTMKDMNDYFPKIVTQLKQVADKCKIAEETAWLEKVLHYNVPGGKMVRALILYNGFMTLMGKDTPGVKEKAINLAWTQELIQAAMLIVDDISDDGKLRRGEKSWHAVMGRDAVFDAILLENCAYALLGLHCDGERLVRTHRLYSEIVFQICIGQNRDNHCIDKSDGKPLFDEFGMDRYVPTCAHKSGGYTFYCPAAAALNLCGIFDEGADAAAHDAARDMSADLGVLYQAQDDYLDIYGRIDHMGKNRTDIRNGKCTWVICEAILRANDEQRRRLKENYGYDDQKKVDKVMRIYEDLKMKEAFLRFEQSLIKKIEDKIQKYSDVIRPEIFTHAVESVRYHINR